jgi:hypothetical protein
MTVLTLVLRLLQGKDDRRRAQEVAIAEDVEAPAASVEKGGVVL